MQRTVFLNQSQRLVTLIYVTIAFHHLNTKAKMIRILALVLFVVQLAHTNAQIATINEQFGDVYGTMCGIAGLAPPSRILIEELISEKNIDAIDQWLKSPLSVRNVYAAEAVLRLRDKGVEIPSEIMDIIEGLQVSDRQISTCNGCIYSKRKISAVLKEIQKLTEIR